MDKTQLKHVISLNSQARLMPTLIARLTFIAMRSVTLVAGLAFIAIGPVALVAGLALIALLAGRLRGEGHASHAQEQADNYQQDYYG